MSKNKTTYAAKIKKSGGSYIIRIPPVQMEMLKLSLDDIVDVSIEKRDKE